MKYTPHIVGAVAVVAIAGAVSGATIGESPMLKRGHTDTLPEAQIVTAGNAALTDRDMPPDHYALETPNGTVEVAELALRGRMHRSRGDMWWDGRRDEGPVNMTASYDFRETASPERIAHEEALLAFTGSRAQYQENAAAPAAPRRAIRAEAPLALAEPAEIEATPANAEAQPTIGNAKTVNVSAALALN